jgi:N6-adenosine-specific RNA methylase IME4
VRSLNELIACDAKFPTIYADPPWAYDNEASRAAAVNHYPTMTLDAICREPVRELAEEHAHLHLWATNGFLREAFDVIDAWGFEFKSCLVWVKDEIGMGNYWRVSHEFLLLGVRGSRTFRDRSIPSWIQAHRTEHSRKPCVVRTLIERVSPGPYLELYGREELPNSAWTVYGNQVERRLF